MNGYGQILKLIFMCYYSSTYTDHREFEPVTASDQISHERSTGSAADLPSCYIEGMPHLPHAPVVYPVPLVP